MFFIFFFVWGVLEYIGWLGGWGEVGLVGFIFFGIFWCICIGVWEGCGCIGIGCLGWVVVLENNVYFKYFLKENLI